MAAVCLQAQNVHDVVAIGFEVAAERLGRPLDEYNPIHVMTASLMGLEACLAGDVLTREEMLEGVREALARAAFLSEVAAAKAESRIVAGSVAPIQADKVRFDRLAGDMNDE